LVVVGDFKERFHKRIASILNLTDLPIEPLCYTEEEFREMIKNNKGFIFEVLKEGENLLRAVKRESPRTSVVGVRQLRTDKKC